MNHSKVLNILISLSITSFLVSILFINSQAIGLCQPDPEGWGCRDLLFNNIGEPLFFGSSALTFVFLLLRFLSKKTFHAWIKFGSWYVPLSILWIIATPVHGDIIVPGKEGLTLYLSVLYIIISLLIIMYTSIRLKSKHGN